MGNRIVISSLLAVTMFAASVGAAEDGKLPEPWDLEGIGKTAHRLGESRILLWSVSGGDEEKTRRERCVVGTVAKTSKGTDYWMLSVVYYTWRRKRWSVAMSHTSYPKGHKLYPGVMRRGSARFDRRPTAADCLEFLGRIEAGWDFDVEDPRNLGVSAENWEWMLGVEPDFSFDAKGGFVRSRGGKSEKGD